MFATFRSVQSDPLVTTTTRGQAVRPRPSGLRRIVVGVVALCATVAVLGGCSTAGGSSTSQSRFVAGDGSVVLLPPEDRQPAPAITGETLSGEPFALADYRGKVVALNVWASWCAPCRAEAPALIQLSNELGPKGVQFIGLDTRDTKAAAEAFVRRFEVPYPNVWDPDAQLQLAFRDSLPPQAIPSTLLVDKQGRVAGRILGEVDRTKLRELLTELANESTN